MKSRSTFVTCALALALSCGGYAQYQLDDGVAEGSIGLTSGGTMTWANEFTAVAGLDTITSIEIAWSRPTGDGVMVPDGTPVLVQLWSDPNNDGNPSDATLLTSVLGTTLNLGDTFISYNIADTLVGAGNRFFVGATITHAAGEFPASIDTSSSAVRSWVAVGADLTAGPFTIDDAGLPGNWMIRATAVPEPGSVAALLTGLGGIAAWRRRRA